ncbi:UDP-glucose/GDP-mannose dehydrogenase family protein [Motiliproteus sp. SC1-56]|uniref:UDP-glucose dehydrogenase family protein n=1 Tax=Motiliproteus sp. SC1-56 TaxID=2799565 RepID=UPI001A8E93C6|nr:UDP-glucose/GDP-mannose dehydrogenase family protein [Motiliproteus sp. SC1-56]
MRVSVYGCGLIGLVTGVALADVGNDVVLVACEGEDIERLRAADISFEEPGLKERLQRELAAGRLRIAADRERGFEHGQVHMLAVTSDHYETGRELLVALATHRPDPITVVNQSTFSMGAALRLKEAMLAAREGEENLNDVYLLVLPSFLQEGAAIQGFTRPQRILLGADEEWGLQLVQELLRPFLRNQGRLLTMPTKAAEFTKYAINGMLATKLSFMNEMANLADQIGVDIEQVRKGVGSDPRIGYDYIYPGCGFGGLKFSEELLQLAATVEENVEESFLLRTVLDTNEQQKEVLFRKAWTHWQTRMRGKTVALLGASFKPNTDHIDNSPALVLMEALWAQGVTVRLYDPKALERVKAHYGPRDDLVLCDSLYQAAEGSDALMIATEWKEFWSPDFERLGELMKARLIFDGRNLYNPEFMKELGFTYFGVGRSTAFV